MWEWILQFAAGIFHTEKLCSRLYSIIEFYLKKSLLNRPLRDLGVTYALHL